MNNLVFFKGRLVGVETKKLENDNTLHRIEILVEEFYFNHVEKLKYETRNKYFMTKFNWKEADFLVDGEYYFIGRVVYKKVESRKAVDKDGNPFKYGTFDFMLDAITDKKEEAATTLLAILKLN